MAYSCENVLFTWKRIIQRKARKDIIIIIIIIIQQIRGVIPWWVLHLTWQCCRSVPVQIRAQEKTLQGNGLDNKTPENRTKPLIVPLTFDQKTPSRFQDQSLINLLSEHSSQAEMSLLILRDRGLFFPKFSQILDTQIWNLFPSVVPFTTCSILCC